MGTIEGGGIDFFTATSLAGLLGRGFELSATASSAALIFFLLV